MALVVGAVVGLAVLPPLATAADVSANYEKYCLKCHGEDGSGNGPAAAALDVSPRNFNDCTAMQSHSREYLVKIIGEGASAVGKSPQMPANSKKLSPEEIEALADYVVNNFCGQK